ncbi:MAG TPA: GAF domain-containing protein [Candidatus Binatia bacterium]|nr:GAF domain-containing protein [Candidatus Binatia bacterium]
MAALRQFRILDTPAEEHFDALVGLALRLCQVPVAMISLVDEHRQWFKAKAGLAQQQTPRDVAFCAYAILKPEPLIVPDALRDTRFARNPLVTGEPSIRFYAGFPLITSGRLELGTLCVADHRPRRLSQQQQQDVKALARQVMVLLELRRTSSRLEEAEEKLKILRPLVPVCSRCNRVRDDPPYWRKVEAFIKARGEAEFIDCLCPECLRSAPAEVSNLVAPVPSSLVHRGFV